MSFAWNAYRLASPIAGAIAPALGVIAAGAERVLWAERMGRCGGPAPADAWVHAASLGEAVAAEALVRELRARRPAANLRLTATTRPGRERLQALDPAACLAPLDTPQATERFFASLRPARLFLIETELWPQWLMRAARGGVPVAVISARLSTRSVGGYRWLGPTFAGLVGGLAAVLCQSEEDRRRWLDLGARPERTEVAGNLKFDALPGPAPDRGAARAALGLDPRRPLLVLASVRPGEVRILADAWRSLTEALRAEWQVVVVPRHPAASSRLRSDAIRAGIAIADGGAPDGGAWRWDDRTGVLGGYYAACEVAFVGGSLRPYGGHNPLEPAAAGAAVIIGPHHGAQAPAMEVLAGAARIASGPALVDSLRELLGDPGRRGSAGAAALSAARAARGAAARAVDFLEARNLWPRS